jgi:hypothetical protein
MQPNKSQWKIAAAVVGLLVLAGAYVWWTGKARSGEAPAAAPKPTKAVSWRVARQEPPQVSQFRVALTRADSIDEAAVLKDLILKFRAKERALKLRIATASRDLRLDQFFATDADAARFYGAEWEDLSTNHKARDKEALALLRRVLDDVAAGDRGGLTAQAAEQVVEEVRARLAELSERNAEANARLGIIINLARQRRQGAARESSPTAGRPPDLGNEFISHESHEETARGEVTSVARVPSWGRNTRRLLDEYRRR